MTTAFGILVLNAPFDRGGYPLDPPRWVTEFDADAFEGRGDMASHADPRKALRFPTAAEAFAFWRTQSTVRPLRDDGRPNRPLTACTVTIEEIPEPA